MEDNKCAIFIFITGVFLICLCLAVSVLWKLGMKNISCIQLLGVASVVLGAFLFFWFIFFIIYFDEKPYSDTHVSQSKETCKIKFSDCEKTIKQILKEDKNEK